MRMISKQTRTFTDVFCLSLDWRVTVMKLLSVDPANYWDTPREIMTEPGV